MTLKEIFEKVTLVVPIHQRNFFNYFNDTVNEILGKYTNWKFVLESNADGTVKEQTDVDDLNDGVFILPLYRNAIVDNILYMSGAGDVYKSGFLTKVEEAYRHYWHLDARTRPITKRARW